MSEVLSTFQLKSGDEAPGFELPDASGSLHALRSISGGKKATVIAFVCNHCPFVVHLADAIGKCAADYAGKGAAFVAINANDVANYPADAPDKMVTFARAHDWDFPYLYDESQEVAKAYGAACTPDFFVFDGEMKLAYTGQFDASRPGNGKPVTGDDLRAVLDAVIAGETIPGDGQPSSGCNIKWKAGNAPAYFG